MTPEVKKPFIAQQASQLNALAGLQKGTDLTTGAEPAYSVGDRVAHTKYGEGTVKAIVKEPRDYKVTVSFDGAGERIMYASFAKLKLL